MFELFEDARLQSVLLSILCGAIVGFEREYKNKSAGFRTVILICFGSTVFTVLSRMGNVSDDRIAANIVTGIGFLGAGVIYQGKFSVQGLTTAAVIWSIAGVGMVVGFEEYGLAFTLTAMMVIVLSLFQKIERMLADIYFKRTIHVTFQDISITHLGEFESFMKEHKVRLQRKGLEKKGQHLTVVYEVTGNRKNIREASEAIISLDYVYAFNNM
ncbi:MgtC/SapB family protein [Sphingobacterium paludis]|uniref:Putative Mg2+ transporter-C (MgtC) family protein n=1 Tax=Sphingobacterium paludis TaxID=1476465 RepID=A0A4R7DBD1_9SPHI|nr:MgtC/SapB family protein [Sphingobacterium paludis]TDS17752.1 putative Mg2+ transporter-C (MgtC) family protein [Sphingobacterium paludis]